MIFYDCVGWIPQILAKNHLPLWMSVWLWLCLFPSATEDMNIFRTWCLTGCSLLYSGDFNHLLCSTWFHLWYSCAYIYNICLNYARNVQTWTHKQNFTQSYDTTRPQQFVGSRCYLRHPERRPRTVMWWQPNWSSRSRVEPQRLIGWDYRWWLGATIPK